MIDTVILRIHDIRKYRSIIKTLDPAQTKGCTIQTATVDGKEIKKLRNQGVFDTKEILDIMKINRTGEFLVKTQFAKQQNASNHYAFAWRADYTGNFLEFNFSIPKYLYGSNILMFTDHIGERGYNVYDCSRLKHNFEIAWGRFGKFINQFVKLEFPDTDFDFRDVELYRIDVCFNQMFRSKEEALKYLEYQKTHSLEAESLKSWMKNLKAST